MRIAGQMLSPPAQELLDGLRSWSGRLGADVVELTQIPIPDDDDYGLELSARLEPRMNGACPIEIGITRPSEQSAICMFLDTWAGIASKSGLTVAPSQANHISLFFEPISMKSEVALELCQQVAAGEVHLRVVSRREKLVGTGGFIMLPNSRFKMRGVGYPPYLASLTSRVGLFSVAVVEYAPWK